MDTQIDIVMKRARGYWFVDGFTEIVAGALFVLLAGLLFFRGNTAQDTPSSWFLPFMGEVAIAKFFGLLTAIVILWWLKDHFTYPRTGFVRGNRITAAQILILVRNIFLFILLPLFGLLALSVLLASGSSVLSSMPVWFPIGVSLIWAILCAIAGKWMGLRRFHLLGIAFLLVGVTVGVWQYEIGLPEFPASARLGILQPAVLETINQTLSSLSLLIMISGIILIFSGVITFLRYRKENPTPYTEEA